MFESVFGAEMPLAARFVLAFLVVLGLIGVAAWAVRRFGTGRLGGTSARGRQPRLAVIDYATVDARRRLILVRRDNVEHLVLIGGPTDVVVEANIVRAVAAPRDVPVPRAPNTAEPLPRAIPLPDNGNGSWPLQPEPIAAAPPRPAPRIEPAADEPAAWPLQPNTDAPKRPHREMLSALADELATRPTPIRGRPSNGPRAQPIEPRMQPPEPRAEPRPEQHSESITAVFEDTRVEPHSQAAQAEPAETAPSDQTIAEMAHRLEAALRKPTTAAEARPEPRPEARERAAPVPPRAVSSIEPAAAPAPSSPPQAPAAPRGVRPAEPKPARPDVKPSQGKTLYDSLEQEMASLLGRPTNKT
jgi:flagellar biogenesis protein FliO